jgi:hypothetical protein
MIFQKENYLMYDKLNYPMVMNMKVEMKMMMLKEYNNNDQFHYHNKLEMMNNRNLK